MNELAREFQGWTSKKSSFHLGEEQIREAIAAHDQTLKETMQRVGASIRPYPTISHEVLVAKCLARKKPFTEDGQKGSGRLDLGISYGDPH